MKTKKQYIAPELTVVSFKTEKGYATSLTTINIIPNIITGYNDNGIGELQVGDQNGFFGGGWNW